MEDMEQPSGERSLHTRSAQACQRCRSLKTRCLPSDTAGICQRCLSAGRECFWAEAPRKTKRVRGPSRISQVEQKIDGLVALVNLPGAKQTSAPVGAEEGPGNGPNGPAIRETQPRHAPGSWFPVASSLEPQPFDQSHDEDADHRYIEGIREIHSFGADQSDISRNPGTIFNKSATNEAPIESTLILGILSSGEGDVLLNQYRTMTESCPFVPIPSHISARDLSTSKPMLLLAILTVTSSQNQRRLRDIDEKYRVELANRAIIHPRRTVSLLQSLLVYLSWYHFVFSHKTQQIYTLIQLAVGLAHELGLYQEHNQAVPPIMRSKPRQLSIEEQCERKRTFLGCYYLSSAISAALMKPNLLKYTEYMGKCGRSLMANPEYHSDRLISHLIALRRIDDQIHDTFHTEDVVNLPITDSGIEMNLRMLESQLEEWRCSKSMDYESRSLELSYAFTDMQLHLVALRPIPPESQMYASSSMQLGALLSTLEAGKRFLDTLIAFPVSEYDVITFPEWMRFPHVVVTMSRLCIPNEAYAAVQWDAKAAQERVRLELYLESLCYRMQSLSTYDKTKPNPSALDFWQVMHMIMNLTRLWYCRKISGNRAQAPQATPNNLATPDTLSSHNHGSTGMFQSSGMSMGEGSGDFFSTPGTTDPSSMDAQSSGDMFGFMRSEDFDIEMFLDMGIWGPDSYHGMGFGGGDMNT